MTTSDSTQMPSTTPNLISPQKVPQNSRLHQLGVLCASPGLTKDNLTNEMLANLDKSNEIKTVQRKIISIIHKNEIDQDNDLKEIENENENENEKNRQSVTSNISSKYNTENKKNNNSLKRKRVPPPLNLSLNKRLHKDNNHVTKKKMGLNKLKYLISTSSNSNPNIAKSAPPNILHFPGKASNNKTNNLKEDKLSSMNAFYKKLQERKNRDLKDQQLSDAASSSTPIYPYKNGNPYQYTPSSFDNSQQQDHILLEQQQQQQQQQPHTIYPPPHFFNPYMVPYPSPYMVPTPYMYPLPPPPTHLVNSNMASFYPSPYYPDLLLSQDIQQNTSINENDLIQQDNDKDDNNNSFQQDMINGDIRIMNNIFTFEFPKDDNLSKDMFLSICNKIWMENVELNKRHHQKH